MPTSITPQALLERIKNNESLTDSFTVTLYGKLPRECNSDIKSTETKEYTEQREALKHVLKSKACPKNLTINITVTDEHGSRLLNGRERTPIEPIFDILARGACPNGLKIVLNHPTTDLCQFELDALKKALTSEKCPDDLELDLGMLSIARNVRTKFFPPGRDGRTDYETLQQGEIPQLRKALETGKGPFGLVIKYERRDKKDHLHNKVMDALEMSQTEYDNFEKVLKNLDHEKILHDINAVHRKIDLALNSEMTHLLERKKVAQSQELNPADQKRYQVLAALKKEIKSITNHEINNMNPTQREAWKASYKEKLQATINNSLEDPSLDKYSDSEKFKIKLLNLITAIFAPLKHLMTGTFFYSTEGKSKEAVQKALDISESIDNKKHP